jgi:hypothetical protein
VEAVIYEFHGDLGWLDHSLAHSECHQKIGRKYGVGASHIVCPVARENDQAEQKQASEKSATNFKKQGFWSL